MLKFHVVWDVVPCDWRIKITVDRDVPTLKIKRGRCARRDRLNYSLSSATFVKTSLQLAVPYNAGRFLTDSTWTLLQAYQQIVVYRYFISRPHLFGVVRQVILECPQSVCVPQELEIKFRTHFKKKLNFSLLCVLRKEQFTLMVKLILRLS
jgi:hypothetical protein